jgi:hypothetical protein
MQPACQMHSSGAARSCPRTAASPCAGRGKEGGVEQRDGRVDWWARWDSNPGPKDYESVLTIKRQQTTIDKNFKNR